jgi:Mg2+/Co2+ transporter CorC
MSNQTKDWMEKLVKNYKLPEDKPAEKKEPVRMLKESQLRIIMDRDKKDLVNKNNK